MRWIFLGLITLLSGCSKNRIDLPWEMVSVPTSLNLYGLEVMPAGEVAVYGGDKWYEGIVLYSDNLIDWQGPDSISNKGVFDLQFVPPSTYLATGTTFQFHKSTNLGQDWAFSQGQIFDTPWRPMYGLHFPSSEIGYAVGGEALIFGQVFKTTDGGASWQGENLPEEIRDVFFIDNEIGFLAGAGVLYRTVDGGQSWQRQAVDGDFFKSVYFPTTEIGYLVGDQGSIWKTTNGGNNWERLRKQNNLFSQVWHFENVFFENEMSGYLAGQNTLVRTTDGGQSFQRLEEVPDCHYTKIRPVGQGRWMAVGKEGCVMVVRE